MRGGSFHASCDRENASMRQPILTQIRSILYHLRVGFLSIEDSVSDVTRISLPESRFRNDVLLTLRHHIAALFRKNPSQEAPVKIHTRMTRTASLLGALVVLVGCADQATAPTATDVVRLVNAANGSIIKSSVVTTTTYCRGAGDCSTSTRNSVVAEKVGRTGMAMMGISAAQTGKLPPGALKRMSYSHGTLSADVAKDANTLWHVELTGDANARGKISGMRLSLNGELLLVQNTKWKNVSGAWYHEHADLTFYVKGQVGVHQEKSYTPTAVLPANAADQSVATLSLVNDHASNFMYVDGGYYDDGSFYYDGGYYYIDGVGYAYCPEWFPICEYFQTGPLPILGGILGQIGGAVQSFSNWLLSVRAAAAEDPDAVTLAETVQFAMEAIAYPSWTNVGTAFLAAEAGGWTGGLVNDFIDAVVGALLDALMLEI